MSPAKSKDQSDRPDCLHCEYYVVTWEAERPRGCRAYEFSSVELPSVVVRASSGEPCQLFRRNKKTPERAKLIR